MRTQLRNAEADERDEDGQHQPDRREFNRFRQQDHRKGGQQGHRGRAGDLGARRICIVATDSARGNQSCGHAKREPVGERQADRGAPHDLERVDVRDCIVGHSGQRR